MEPSELYARLQEELDDVTAMRYLRAIKKRATHYPLQYITGFTYFLEYEFLCRENVLIPRYDTENVVFRALEMSPDRNMKVLDMCTGSGCIGISFQLMRRDDEYDDEVYLVDVSDDAVSLACDNADSLNSDVRVVKSDLFDALQDENGNPHIKFDMIMCNPPYIRTKDIYNLMKDVRDFEPRLALDGSSDGLEFYRIITKEASRFLNENGIIVYEIGCEQYLDVRDILKENGFQDIHRLMDMSGLDRVVSAVL
mgnify:CR=1 FL=1